MKSSELRARFIEFFKERGHTHVSSAPLIPPDDPTMLFTSAGMVQFKRLWAGEADPLPYIRACTVQKCLRAGGKGSDLENVGRTLRHHTFFEMLGNFSFGDYFKREAIAWAWEFVTGVMEISSDRLWVTTFEEDPEAAEIWEKEQGLPRSRIIPLDAQENFWGPAGDTGACGPCSEIKFFMGSAEELEEAKNQDIPVIARRMVDEGDVFFEIWNMVFPQFDQQRNGARPPLKYRGIDTGAGLERMITSVNFIQSRAEIGSPYETDLLWDIVKAASEITGLEYVRRYEPLKGRDPAKTSRTRLGLNAIADHTRALVFALSEGMMPSNEGRGYVLRRIQRRALRFAHLLGVEDPFMFRLVDPVIEIMGEPWPEIRQHPDHVKKIIRLEEEHFLKTLVQGEAILSGLIEEAREKKRSSISGEDVFKLHATYGYPVDLTDEVARDAGLEIERSGYDQAMTRHREEAKKSWKGASLECEADILSDIFEKFGPTEFLWENEDRTPVVECETPVLAILNNGERIDVARKGDKITLILEESCFYGESGGQIGDIGLVTVREEDHACEVVISDTRKTPSGIHLHLGEVTSGEIRVGDVAQAAIDAKRRFSIMRSHTATHLLQKALKMVVGLHVTQQGSSVTPEGFRFDFTNPEPVTQEQIQNVERIVQEEILKNIQVVTKEMPLEEARKIGAIAPFGEKYGATVRVVQIGNFSLEFCGGTHCSRTGQIGSMAIIGEASIASGVRRIEAKTGMAAFEEYGISRRLVQELCRQLSSTPEDLPSRVGKMAGEVKDLKKEMQKLRREKAAGDMKDLSESARDVGGFKILTYQAEEMTQGELRSLADTLGAKIKDGVVFLGSAEGEKVSLVCKVAGAALGRVSAAKIVRETAKIVGGSGGGRDDIAQAGGKFPDKLPEALAAVESLVKMLANK